MKRNGEVVVDLAEQIRTGILAGSFTSGDSLPEARIMEQFGCSRTSAREALRMLIHSGLVAKTPNQSYRIAQFDESDLAELTSLRLILEQLAARVAFGRHDLISGMSDAMDQLREAVQRGDRGAAIRANRSFHEAIVNAAEHSRLQQAYERLSDQIEFAFMTLGHLQRDIDRLVGEHEYLFHIAKNGSLDEFIAALGDHIHGGLAAPVAAREPAAPRTVSAEPLSTASSKKVSDNIGSEVSALIDEALGW